MSCDKPSPTKLKTMIVSNSAPTPQRFLSGLVEGVCESMRNFAAKLVKIGDIALGEFPLLLAPMEDVSDPPFRYVCKQQELTELLSAIKAVLSGYSYFPNQALHVSRGRGGSETDMVNRLSAREMTVLQQLARGRSNKEIADSMFLSNKTVSTYKSRLLLKLNARSLVDLIELAQRQGLS